MLGLNPLEQEVLDLTNEVARNGFIFFPEFCSIVHRKYREEDEDLFRQNMFKVEAANKINCLPTVCRLYVAPNHTQRISKLRSIKYMSISSPRMIFST